MQEEPFPAHVYLPAASPLSPPPATHGKSLDCNAAEEQLETSCADVQHSCSPASQPARGRRSLTCCSCHDDGEDSRTGSSWLEAKTLLLMAVDHAAQGREDGPADLIAGEECPGRGGDVDGSSRGEEGSRGGAEERRVVEVGRRGGRGGGRRAQEVSRCHQLAGVVRVAPWLPVHVDQRRLHLAFAAPATRQRGGGGAGGEKRMEEQ
eukprot:754005-Hanusia_phi.AAC.1